MRRLAHWLNELKCREEGQTLSEYGLILFFLVLIVIGAVTLFGESIAAMWDTVAETFDLL